MSTTSAAIASTSDTDVADAPTASRVGWLRSNWVAAVTIYLLVRVIGIVTLSRFTTLRSMSMRDVLGSWDGKWMLAIAEYGYRGVPYSQTDAHGLHSDTTAYAFFPGYPMLVGAVAHIPGVSAFAAAVVVNVVSGCIGAVGVATLGTLCARSLRSRSPRQSASLSATPGWLASTFGLATQITTADEAYERRVGFILVVLFAAAPMGIVLSMAYTEALFCALVAWALVGVLQQNWWLAAGMTLLAGLTRPTAVVLVGVVMLAALLARRDGLSAWAAVIVSPLGYLGYLGFVWQQSGSPTGWFTIQTQGWGTEFDWGRASWEFINYALINGNEVAVTATAWIMIATVALTVVAIWERLPWPVVLYGVLIVASIALSGGLMMSRPRLLLPAFVLLIPIALTLARARVPTRFAVIASVVIFSSWFGGHMITVYPHAI